jgi:hypothetical protein
VIPPESDAEFAASMEVVLEVYARPYDIWYPVLCLDEKPIQIIYHPQSGWFEDTPLKGGAEEGYPLKGVHEGICLLEARQRAWNRSRASRISP